MSQKKPATKENLTWKINYLAAQVGETTHMKTAVLAASRAKYQRIHGSNDFDQSSLKQELLEARKKKLESKLFQARKELKTSLKKAKTAETQKQIKKIKNARETLEKKEEAKKPVTEEDVKKLESELDILKNINLDTLAEKSLKTKLSKNSTLKNEPLIKDVIATIQCEKPSDQITQNMEARILSQKVVMEEFTKIFTECGTILKGNQEKVDKMKEDQLKKRAKKMEKKRKAEEEAKKPTGEKKRHIAKGISSEFIETLGGNDKTNEDWEDKEFEKIYHGEKKNRVGQRQRRKQWEEKYGRDANHLKKEYEKREEKRAANPDYRPKKKAEPIKQKHQMETSEPVHPSWQAKRMQEEMMSKALSGKGTSNNKIVFDDAD